MLTLEKKEKTKKKYSVKKKDRQSKYQHLTTSDKDIQRVRIILKMRQQRGSLSDNQTAAFDMHKDKKLKDLQEHEREQILKILNDIESTDKNESEVS